MSYNITAGLYSKGAGMHRKSTGWHSLTIGATYILYIYAQAGSYSIDA